MGENETWRAYNRGLRQWDKVGKDFESLKKTNEQLYSHDGKFPMGTVNKKS